MNNPKKQPPVNVVSESSETPHRIERKVSRRNVLRTVGIGVAAAAAGGVVGGVIGANAGSDTGGGSRPASNPRTQAAGFYRVPVGGFVVTAVSDGTFGLDADELMLNVTPSDLHAQLDRSFVQSPVESSVNAFVIDTGRERILIDTGAGTYLGSGNGKLHDNLTAAGFSTDSFDIVAFTHLHQDHVGGMRIGGRPAFTNRRTQILAERSEADYWLSDTNESAASEDQRPFFEAARTSLAPYRDRLAMFTAGDEIAPGVTAEAVPGHTPGHVGFRVADGGDELLIWGDVVHLPEVQFPEPSVAITFDSDPTMAVTERETLLRDVADRRYRVAGAHLPFPGIGHVRAAVTGYDYIPMNYTTMLGGHS